MQDMQPQEPMNVGLPDGGIDKEGAMAKADLYKLATYSFKLFKKIQDEDQLEGWVQAKITKSADYIASVYHYLEYEMKFSKFGEHLENSDVYNESQRAELRNMLLEAKSKLKDLKVNQAEKLKDKKEKKVDEGTIFGGHDQECSECGGTGMVRMPERQVPETVKTKVEKYNRQAKAFHAASKRIDKNKNGIPDDEEMEEGFEAGAKTGSTFKTKTGVATKTDTGVKHTNTSYNDEEHGEPVSKVKSRSAAEKAGDKAADKAQEKESKAYEKKHPGTVKRYKDGKEVAEGFEAGAKTGSTFKTKTGVATKTATGLKHTNTSHSDEEHGEPVSKVKSRSAAEKAGDKAADKAQEKDYKAAKKANPEGVRRYSLGKQVDEAKKPDFLDMDKDGDKKEPMKKAVADKKKNPFGKKVDEALKGGQKKLDQDKDGDIEADDLAKLRAKKKVSEAKKEKEPEGLYSSKRQETDSQRIARLAREKRQAQNKERMKNDFNAEMERESVEESKPSAGLSKAKKSAVVKDAKAGKDIGKPGKSFDKVAKSAGGGEKGKKIAAAAMWKNIKESVQQQMVAQVQPSADNDLEEAGEDQTIDKIIDFLGKQQPEALAAATKAGPDAVAKLVQAVIDQDAGGATAQPAAAPLAESADMTRMKEFLTRLNG